MTTVPPAPPPCPPPPNITVNASKTGFVDKKRSKFRVSCDGYTLPDPRSELRQACMTAGLLEPKKNEDTNESRPVLLCHYQQVEPVIQDGPKCGLVALCMSSKLVCEKALDVERAFSYCKDKGYTMQGEMFSADAMAEAARTLCQCEVTLMKDVANNQDSLVQYLMKGLPVLFPYDADRNHGPGLRKGHAAHWAVLTGVVVQSTVTEVIETFYDEDDTEDQIYHLKDPGRLPSLDDLVSQELYVCCRQGKSNYMRLLKLSDIVASSCQMKEISDEVMKECNSQILPASFISLQTDLANKAICLG